MTDLVVTGDLIVDGTSTLNNTLKCRSDGFLTGFLRVGALANVGLSVLEGVQIKQDLSVVGDSSLDGKLTVNGGDGAFVEGPLIVNDILRTNTPHGIVCGGELQVAQDAVLQETLMVSQRATFKNGAEVTGGEVAITALKGAPTTAPTLTTTINPPGLGIFVDPGGSGKLSGSIVFRGTGASVKITPGQTLTLDFAEPFDSTMRVFLQTGNNNNAAQTWGGLHWDVASVDGTSCTFMTRGADTDDFGNDGFLYLYYFIVSIGFI
jgi:hypothetical protein